MDKIRHKMIHGHADVMADHFPSALADALDNILDTAVSIGGTVDWSTLQVEAPDVIEAREASGARSYYSDDQMRVSVDVVIIVEDE